MTLAHVEKCLSALDRGDARDNQDPTLGASISAMGSATAQIHMIGWWRHPGMRDKRYRRLAHLDMIGHCAR